MRKQRYGSVLDGRGGEDEVGCDAEEVSKASTIAWRMELYTMRYAEVHGFNLTLTRHACTSRLIHHILARAKTSAAMRS